MTKYYLYYVLIYGGLGAFIPYIVPYLEGSLGLSVAQIGIITSIPSIIGILVVPLWGIITDVTKKDKRILGICIAINCVIMGMYSSVKLFPILLLVATLAEAFRYAISPLADNITTDYCKHNNINYGIIRSGGSVGFALISFLTGQLIKVTSNSRIIFLVYIVLFVASLLVLPFLNSKKYDEVEKMEGSTLKKDLKELIKDKSYLWLLAIVICTISISEVTNAYQGLYLIDLGASQGDIGTLVIFTALPEIFFMAKINKLVLKYGYKKVFKIGILTFLLRWITCLFATSPTMFILTAPLTALAFSIMLVAYIGYIKEKFSSEIQATALTITSMAIGISSAVIKLPVGLGIDVFGLEILYIISIVITIIGFIVCSIKKEDSNKTKTIG
ncbi:MAG: MFS transporter [Paraclostridium sp.]